MMFVSAPDSWDSMEAGVLPVDCSMRSKKIATKSPELNMVTMDR